MYSLIDILIWDSLRNAVARYGIEGTEDKIKELYSEMPYAKYLLLQKYYETYKKN